MFKFATKHYEREEAILTALRLGPRTASDIAWRCFEEESGRKVSALLRSMRERGVIQYAGTVKYGTEDTSHTAGAIVLTYALSKAGEKRSEEVRQRCPDDGACHHNCLKGECFRVHHASPLGRSAWFKDEMESYEDPLSIEAIFDA